MRKAKRQKPRTMQIGAKIRVRCNGMSWSGQSVPIGTIGTTYIHPRMPRHRSVKFEGFPELQLNGYPFGIGGTIEQTHVPDWCEVID